jgi:translation initiation factor 2B subunit (eIF-2B alpha/beta/delta family)/8-oxo-dGTP pyrophosphatase MutT (NUDIX family)
MDERHVVTSFLERDGRILVLRRSERVGTYRGRWAGVSGSIEPGASPLEQAYRELAEELGLGPDDVELVAAGRPLTVPDEALQRRWIVHPFRFRLRHPERLRLDWEHTELRWIEPGELAQLDTVPMLAETWQRVAPGNVEAEIEALVAAIEHDTTHGAARLAADALRTLATAAERLPAGTPAELIARLEELAQRLAVARPGMAPVRNAVARFQATLAAPDVPQSLPELRATLARTAAELIDRLETARQRAAERAAAVLPTDAPVLTCTDSATVEATLRAVYDRHGRCAVLAVSSTTPDGLDHGALLAARLRRAGIAVELVALAALGDTARRAGCGLLGADTVFGDGSVVNGTPSLRVAEALAGAGRPLYVVCDSFKRVPDPPPPPESLPPGFDLVPAALITQIIIEE